LHVVPLSSAALAVLDRQLRTGDAVFRGRSGAPLSYASFGTAPAKAGINACTPHGWRSCFRDWCGDIGDVPRDLAEAALAHGLNATEGAYRKMTAVERRREVMTRHADWLNERRGHKGCRIPNQQEGLTQSTNPRPESCLCLVIHAGPRRQVNHDARAVSGRVESVGVPNALKM
jgi:hypothetical protein